MTKAKLKGRRGGRKHHMLWALVDPLLDARGEEGERKAPGQHPLPDAKR